MKTSELAGAALDWAVAAALNRQYKEDRVIKVCRVEATTPPWLERENYPGSAPYYHRFYPSTDWGQAGSIIEREGITTIRCDDDYGTDSEGFCTSKRIPVWAATTGQHSDAETYGPQGDHWGNAYSIDADDVSYGPTPLIAAMRCFVASKLGDDVEIPSGL